MAEWSYILTPDPATNTAESATPTSLDDTGEEHCLRVNTAHDAAAQELVLFQFLQSPRITKLVSIYSRQIQELEDALWLELQQRDLSQADGIYLDQIGTFVGQPRSGLLDTEYRKLLQARIQANKSKGTSRDIISIFSALFTTGGRLYEDFPAKVVLDMDDEIADYDVTTVFQVMGAGVSSGVQFMLLYQLSPNAEIFKFAPTLSTPVIDANHGFGNVAQTTGGKLRGAMT